MVTDKYSFYLGEAENIRLIIDYHKCGIINNSNYVDIMNELFKNEDSNGDIFKSNRYRLRHEYMRYDFTTKKYVYKKDWPVKVQEYRIPSIKPLLTNISLFFKKK